ncbi:MAG: methyltransferase domain-containing protein [Myxococcota bacterium]
MIPTTNYDEAAPSYATHRRPDPRIARELRHAIGDAKSVVNVGAGMGAYEPRDLDVTPVEPSQLGQRHPARERVVRASAENLPFDDDSFDVSLAILTVHHWHDLDAGLLEMRRVARRRIVILTWDPQAPEFWLTRDYFPDILETDLKIFPRLDRPFGPLKTPSVRPIPIPFDCQDGFLGAYWRRPERYLDPSAREAISTFGKITRVEERVEKLRTDIESGAWRRRNSELLDAEVWDIGYRLLIFENSDALTKQSHVLGSSGATPLSG